MTPASATLIPDAITADAKPVLGPSQDPVLAVDTNTSAGYLPPYVIYESSYMTPSHSPAGWGGIHPLQAASPAPFHVARETFVRPATPARCRGPHGATQLDRVRAYPLISTEPEGTRYFERQHLMEDALSRIRMLAVAKAPGSSCAELTTGANGPYCGEIAGRTFEASHIKLYNAATRGWHAATPTTAPGRRPLPSGSDLSCSSLRFSVPSANSDRVAAN